MSKRLIMKIICEIVGGIVAFIGLHFILFGSEMQSNNVMRAAIVLNFIIGAVNYYIMTKLRKKIEPKIQQEEIKV